MTYRTFPISIDPESSEWGYLANSQSHVSPLSGSEDTLELPGMRWIDTLLFSGYTRAEAAELEAFIYACRGKAGRFYLWNHARPTPRGTASGAPVVNGGGQLGGSISTSGWTPNAAGVLLPGDFVGIGGELKAITAQVNADAGGVALLPIEPPQRYAPANGSAVVTTRPTALFRLVEDRQVFRHLAALTDFTLMAVETF